MIDKAIFALPGVGRILGLLAASAALQALAVLGQAWSLSRAITNLWLGGAVIDQALLVAVFLACFIGRQGVLCAQSALLDAYAYEQANALRRSLLEKIFTTNARLVQDHGTGSVTAAVLEGADQVERTSSSSCPRSRASPSSPPSCWRPRSRSTGCRGSSCS